MRFVRTVVLGMMLMGSAMFQEPPAFKVDVETVQVLATVRDGQGRLVQDLKAEDFVLIDGGDRREITNFATQTDTPLVLGLLVDTSMSQRRILEDERKASDRFFEQVLRPDRDRAFVLSFDVEAELMEDLSESRSRLQAALKRLDVPREPSRRGIGTVLYDAVFLASDEVLKPESGRKALVILSDGVDMGSMVDIEAAIEAAQRTDSVIYTVRYFDSEMNYGGRSRPGVGRGRRPGGGRGGGRRPSGRRPQLPDGEAILQRMARETGGRSFEVSKTLKLEEIFRQIEEELRHQYIIGFPPSDGDSEGGFRRIELRAKNKDLSVRARHGYYAGPE